jgi:hypothetical protein
LGFQTLTYARWLTSPHSHVIFTQAVVVIKRWWFIFAFLMILLVIPVLPGDKARATTPTRLTVIPVAYYEYVWWLIDWQTNIILCQVKVDHEGLPSSNEALTYCGVEIQAAWLSTPPCNPAEGRCQGVYLQLISSTPKEREVIIELPTASVEVSLDNCTPLPPENICPLLPGLRLTGKEPLPNETITAIAGLYGDQSFTCTGSGCLLPLGPTSLQGLKIEFWAHSSYGDVSPRFTAQVRVIDTGVTTTPGGWYVDVISEQWQGAPLTGCARTWQAFPPVGEPPAWLNTPDDHALMASDEPYFYLAGRLISQGLVDASACPFGGLLPNGYADACGLEQARPLVQVWQNQFDEEILTAAQDTGVPGQLLKNLFAQESQFWPGLFRVKNEFGLGQITDNGADSIFLWNSDFYEKFCPLVLSSEACSGGYLSLLPYDQAMLRGALALQAKTDCQDCPEGVNLDSAGSSVDLFANTLLANCAQVNQTVQTATQQVAGTVSTYEDLWRFTIANYQAGPGCVAYAIHNAWQNGGGLTWENVAQQFTDPCKGVVPYVDRITR